MPLGLALKVLGRYAERSRGVPACRRVHLTWVEIERAMFFRRVVSSCDAMTKSHETIQQSKLKTEQLLYFRLAFAGGGAGFSGRRFNGSRAET